MSDKNTRNITDKVQTVIFLCFLIIFPIFALAFCFYSQTNHELSEVLDKSFSVSIGVFGGAATLTAAYIASLLFNDWREQHNKQVQNQISLTVYDSYLNISSKVDELANDLSILQELIDTYEYPVTHEILYKHGNIAYLTNINSRISEAGLIFTDFLLHLQSRLKVIGQIDIYADKYKLYHGHFTKFHEYPLRVDSVQDELNKFECVLIGYKDLLNLLKSNEIHPILEQLKAK